MTELLGPDPDELLRRKVWEKGFLIRGREHERDTWRMDCRFDVIRYSEHGNRGSPWGWEIDRIRSNALFGSSEIANLRPLNCCDIPRDRGLQGGQCETVSA